MMTNQQREKILEEWAEANMVTIHTARLFHDLCPNNNEAQEVGDILAKAEVHLMLDPMVGGKWGYHDLLKQSISMGLKNAMNS